MVEKLREAALLTEQRKKQQEEEDNNNTEIIYQPVQEEIKDEHPT